MLVRFSNADGCPTCTQTIDFNKVRAICMFTTSMTRENAEENSYFVRLSFDDGRTYLAKENMILAEAINYRNKLEGYWMPYNTLDSNPLVEA